jgi:pimeloyl-ACP methyl ester carboxylesterase
MLNTILVSLALLLGVILLAAGGFVAYRYFAPRHTPKIMGEYAIAELFSLPINGVKQWLLIRGVDRRNPVLLFVHGGPGSAHIGILRNFQKELEKYFVVVQWDQRGAGLSGNEPVPDETYHKEQFVADGLEVTRYLRERFQQEKIFLVGHSWGSGLGYILAVRHPEYYRAFAGLGQMSRDGEVLAYAETLKVARAANHREAIKELELLGAPPYKNIPKVKGVLHQAEPGHEAFAGSMVRFKWSEVLGGDSKYIKIANLVVKELLFSTEYTLTDAAAWLKNKAHSVNLTYQECNDDLDLYQEGTGFKIPVFFLLGKWDLLTVPGGAVALMETITAPQKEIIWFDTGHEIHWERPKEYQKALIDKFNNLPRSFQT